MEAKVRELEDRESRIVDSELKNALLNPVKQAEFNDQLQLYRSPKFDVKAK